MLKKYILLIITVIFTCISANAGYDFKLPVEGESIANDTLQFQVMNKIYKMVSSDNPYCYDYSIKDTQVVHYPYDVVKKNNKYVKGYWKELWTVNECGVKKQLPITFYIHKKSTSFNIER